MRRIEAVTGAGADRLARERDADARAGRGGRRRADGRRRRGPRRRAPGRAPRDEAPAQGRRRRPACPQPTELAARAEEVAPGVRLVAAAVPYESIDALKAAAKAIRRGPADRASSPSLLDDDEPQLFVTVSDDLVERGHRRRRPRPGRHARRSTARAAAGREMAQGKGTRRDGLRRGLRPPSGLDRPRPTRRPDGLLAPDLATRRGRSLAACTALDVGTEFAKALVFEIDDAGLGTVRGVGRKRQGLSHMQSGTVADIAAVVDNCAVALQEAEEMAGFRPSQVVIGIAGELVKGFTTTHSQERKKPDQPITENELQKLIDTVQREALREAERAITWETGLPHVDVRLVHAAVTGAAIDGYALTNPVGFQGRHVKIGIFNAFAPLVHLGALQSVAIQLDLELLEIVAEPYAVARVLGTEQVRQSGALFVDVGGGTTDVALVRQGGIEGTRMFALGGRAFTKSPRRSAGPAVPAGRGAQGRLRARAAGRVTRRGRRRSSATTCGSGRPAWSS